MRKRTKLVSIVLALMLAVSTFAVLSFSASAAEDEESYDWDYSEATPDTAKAVDHIELVSLPTKTEYTARFTEYISLEGLEYNVYYTDGTVSKKNGESECTWIKCVEAEDVWYYLPSELSAKSYPIGENKVELVYSEEYLYANDENGIEFAEYTINVAEDPFWSTVKSIEIIQKPDKVFTDVYHFYESGDLYVIDYEENSIVNNINGAKLKINFTDGTSDVHTFIKEKPQNNEFGMGSDEWYYKTFGYWIEEEDRYVLIDVKDLGNYKAEVSFAGKTTVFEVNHTGATDSDNGNTNPTGSGNATVNPTVPSPAKPATSDTATSDVVSSANGNGTVATGNAMYPIIILAVMVSAGAVLAICDRKRYFK